MNKQALLGVAWSLSVVVGAGAAARQSPAGAAGHWEGTIAGARTELDIIVDLAQPSQRHVGGHDHDSRPEREGLRALSPDR